MYCSVVHLGSPQETPPLSMESKNKVFHLYIFHILQRSPERPARVFDTSAQTPSPLPFTFTFTVSFTWFRDAGVCLLGTSASINGSVFYWRYPQSDRLLCLKADKKNTEQQFVKFTERVFYKPVSSQTFEKRKSSCVKQSIVEIGL